MELLFIALYLIPTALILTAFDNQQEEVLKDLPIIFPSQIMLIRAWIYILAVFWPVVLIAGNTFMKPKD